MKKHVNRWVKTTVAVVALMALSPLTGKASPSPIQFSVTGTADSSLYGYIAGESYTFTWTLNGAFTDNADSVFGSTFNFWGEESVSEAPIFSDVNGDGLTGSWVRPTVNSYDPWSDVWVETNSIGGYQFLELWAGNDSAYSIGLQANGTEIGGVQANSIEIGNIFSFPETYTDPNVYFTDYTGTYSVNSGKIHLMPVNYPTDSRIDFTATSLTISQIPEPSSAVLIVLTTGGLAFIRRRLVM